MFRLCLKKVNLCPQITAAKVGFIFGARPIYQHKVVFLREQESSSAGTEPKRLLSPIALQHPVVGFYAKRASIELMCCNVGTGCM